MRVKIFLENNPRHSWTLSSIICVNASISPKKTTGTKIYHNNDHHGPLIGQKCANLILHSCTLEFSLWIATDFLKSAMILSLNCNFFQEHTFYGSVSTNKSRKEVFLTFSDAETISGNLISVCFAIQIWGLVTSKLFKWVLFEKNHPLFPS